MNRNKIFESIDKMQDVCASKGTSPRGVFVISSSSFKHIEKNDPEFAKEILTGKFEYKGANIIVDNREPIITPLDKGTFGKGRAMEHLVELLNTIDLKCRKKCTRLIEKAILIGKDMEVCSDYSLPFLKQYFSEYVPARLKELQDYYPDIDKKVFTLTANVVKTEYKKRMKNRIMRMP